MTILGLIGAIAVTGLVLLLTVWYVGAIFMQWQLAGLNCLTVREWVWITILGIVLVGLWIGWFMLIGDITITIGIE